MLDDLDRRLVAALHVMPRGSFDELSSVLGVDASTIGRRFARLDEERIVRVIGQVDWAMVSETLPVHLFIDTAGTSPSVVMAQLLEMSEVQYLAQTSGSSAVYATVHAASEGATAALLDAIYDLPGISALQSYPVLAADGRGSGWDPQLLDDDERRRALARGGARVLGGSPRPPRLEPAEREIVERLLEDGRASAASLGRAVGLAPSTAHRVVRRVLDKGWVRPRVEIDAALLGFTTPFVLRAGAQPGATRSLMASLSKLPQTRFTTQVAGRTSIVCTGLMTDRAALGAFIDEKIAELPGLKWVEVDIVLVERRRQWMDRDPTSRLGQFKPPPLL
jgi:DNA-binding Lrp family transcriptional regulator